MGEHDDIQAAVEAALRSATTNGSRPVSEQACAATSGKILAAFDKVGDSVDGLRSDTGELTKIMERHLGTHEGRKALSGKLIALCGLVAGATFGALGLFFGG